MQELRDAAEAAHHKLALEMVEVRKLLSPSQQIVVNEGADAAMLCDSSGSAKRGAVAVLDGSAPADALSKPASLAGGATDSRAAADAARATQKLAAGGSGKK